MPTIKIRTGEVFRKRSVALAALENKKIEIVIKRNFFILRPF